MTRDIRPQERVGLGGRAANAGRETSLTVDNLTFDWCRGATHY
jgi:hypothetical protein